MHHAGHRLHWPLRSARLLLQIVSYLDSGRLVVDLISESATIELTS